MDPLVHRCNQCYSHYCVSNFSLFNCFSPSWLNHTHSWWHHLIEHTLCGIATTRYNTLQHATTRYKTCVSVQDSHLEPGGFWRGNLVTQDIQAHLIFFSTMLTFDLSRSQLPKEPEWSDGAAPHPPLSLPSSPMALEPGLVHFL